MRAFKFLLALFATGMMLGASKAQAGDTFASFTTTNPLGSNLGFELETSGGVSTLSNREGIGDLGPAGTPYPVQFSFDPALLPGTFFPTAFTLNATSTDLVGADPLLGNRTQGGFDGFMEFRFGATLLLRVDFTDAAITALPVGSGTQAIVFSTNNVTFSSDLVSGFSPINEFNINLLSVNPPFPTGDLTGTQLSFVQAAGSGEFSTGDFDRLELTPVPPGLVLVLSAFPVLGLAGYLGRRRFAGPAPMAA